MEIKFLQVQCDWDTVIWYYAFPTNLDFAHQVAYPQNKYCGWGEHCHRDYKFESITKEPLDWPGITNCFAGDSGTIATSTTQADPF